MSCSKLCKKHIKNVFDNLLKNNNIVTTLSLLLQQFPDQEAVLATLIENKQVSAEQIAECIIKGVISPDYESPIWTIKNNYGNTVAHIVVMQKNLDIPYPSSIWFLTNNDKDTIAHFNPMLLYNKVDFTDKIWRLKNNEGNTPLHYLVSFAGTPIIFPEDSDLWLIANNYGQTIAHITASNHGLPFDEKSHLWNIKDQYGDTPAHESAQFGHLLVNSDSPLWRLKNRLGDTPAHKAAAFNSLNFPYEDPIWMLRNDLGDTPAHVMAQRCLLNAPPNSYLWLLPNNYGTTPAHIMATFNVLKVDYDSIIWRVKDFEGTTPAHLAARNHKLYAPYSSDLWLVLDEKYQTPAILSQKTEQVLAHHKANQYPIDLIIKTIEEGSYSLSIEKMTPVGFIFCLRYLTEIENCKNSAVQSRLLQYSQEKEWLMEGYNQQWDAQKLLKININPRTIKKARQLKLNRQLAQTIAMLLPHVQDENFMYELLSLRCDDSQGSTIAHLLVHYGKIKDFLHEIEDKIEPESYKRLLNKVLKLCDNSGLTVEDEMRHLGIIKTACP